MSNTKFFDKKPETPEELRKVLHDLTAGQLSVAWRALSEDRNMETLAFAMLRTSIDVMKEMEYDLFVISALEQKFSVVKASFEARLSKKANRWPTKH